MYSCYKILSKQKIPSKKKKKAFYFFFFFLKHLAFQELLIHSFSSTSRAGTETWFRYSRPRLWNTKSLIRAWKAR